MWGGGRGLRRALSFSPFPLRAAFSTISLRVKVSGDLFEGASLLVFFLSFFFLFFVTYLNWTKGKPIDTVPQWLSARVLERRNYLDR